MPDVARTTVYLDAADYRRLKALARSEGTTAAALVREAVSDYTARRAGRRRPRSIGGFRSGGANLAERAEELLSDLGCDE